MCCCLRLEALQQVRDSLESKISPAEMRISSLAADLKEAEDARDKSEAKLAWLKRYSDQSTADLKKELDDLREELAVAARDKGQVRKEIVWHESS